MNAIRLATVAFLALAFGGPVQAEDNWWSRARDILGAGQSAQETPGGLYSNADADTALREALSIGARNVTTQLGRHDGFWGDPQIQVALPSALRQTQNMLSPLGLSGPIDDLHERMNRGAEAAAPVAADLFLNAINTMTVDDAIAIVRGGDDSATRYLRSRTEDQLAFAFRPHVETALDQSGALNAVDAVAGRYNVGGLSSNVRSDLTNHVVGASLDGVFFYLAREEEAIRSEPIRWTSEALRRVFGG